MDFADSLIQYSRRVSQLRDSIKSEEATKTSLIMPFFTVMGYDVFNPMEFTPEFTADVGIKKGEKVDYAIFLDGSLKILIEVKSITEHLTNHDSQLFRYFGTACAKFAVLTNGRFFKFFTDLDTPNRMDEKPFLEIDMLDLKDAQITELKKFTKSNFDIDIIADTASELKYSNAFKMVFQEELSDPSEDMIRLFLKNIYTGVKTVSVIEKFRPIVKKALNNYITELMNSKIANALSENEVKEKENELPAEEESPEINSKIVTTEEEMESFYMIKGILSQNVDSERLFYKDTESYFAVILDNNSRKQICRIMLSGKMPSIQFYKGPENYSRVYIKDISDIYKYSEELKSSLSLHLNNTFKRKIFDKFTTETPVNLYHKNVYGVTEAQCIADIKGFTVLEGSVISEASSSIPGHVAEKRKNSNIENGILKESVLFPSASFAASFVSGTNESGNRFWTFEDGRRIVDVLSKQ